jgi:hypothetical protein
MKKQESPDTPKKFRFSGAGKYPGEINDYVYTDRGTGEIVIVQMTYTERMKREEHGFLTLPDGRELRYTPIGQTVHDTGAPPEVSQAARSRAKWPMTTVLTGVAESQVEETREKLAKHGVVGATVNNDGTVTWDSPKARRRYCEVMNLGDRNGGYSDPQFYNR